jgi:hypothetical protein
VNYERDQPKDRRHLGHVAIDNGSSAVYVGLGRWTTLLPLAPDSELYSPGPTVECRRTVRTYDKVDCRRP